MSFVGSSDNFADIEQTLVHASIVGTVGQDYRVLRSLCRWAEVHFTHVNVDRLSQILKQCETPLVVAFWSALASGLLANDLRFRKIGKMYSGEAVALLGESTEFHVSRHGYDDRLNPKILRAPGNLLTSRPGDVVSPESLVATNRVYFWRTAIGPTWRADAWAFLERNPDASATQVANAVGCSYGAAWKYVQSFNLWQTAT